MSFAKECNSKRIDNVTLFKPKFTPNQGSNSNNGNKRRRRQIKLFHLIFMIIYLYMGYWCFQTCGEPYRKFLLKADREGFQVMEGTTKMRAQLEYALADINNPDRRKSDKVGWFDFLSMDIEEAADAKKRAKEQSVLDSLPKHMRVPGKYMPEFLPMLLLGIFATLHVLIILMQHWSVKFNVNLNFRPVDVDTLDIPEELLEIPDEDEDDNGEHNGLTSSSSDKGKSKKKTLGERIYDRAEVMPIPSHLPTHAMIEPSDGKPVLTTLLYLPTLGLTFTYHRRRYVYNNTTSTWTKIRCQTNMETSFFNTWDGFTNDDQITASQVRFGQNVFEVKQPTFSEMYKAQLLSPFTVFQLFCVVLWMLDDYWQYSFFNLFMILMFEATVVFSRVKSLQALKGMGSKPRPVYVYRMEEWIEVESCDVLPGDILSLTRHTPHFAKKDVNPTGAGARVKKSEILSKEFEDGDVVPADLLLLKGSAVVNEASLTGESVPQMKEGMGEIIEGENLSMKTQHKAHVLYAGTKMLQCKGADTVDAEAEAAALEDGVSGNSNTSDKDGVQEKLYSSLPKPPDGGAVCFVLRTGFLSAQGKLVRMIEGSQEKVKGHERETALLLLLLFFFAVASSGYVLYHGLRNEKRSQYELLLHCILIITSVIPPELPMQMALAVQNSLMTLMKMQVFCTEPYRVPIAGKLNACLFDKTGTLTTDELVAVGVCDKSKLITKNDVNNSTVDDSALLTAMTKITNEAGLVIAGCHSLVLIEGEVTGDPLESAALKAMRWGIDKDSGRASPLASTDKRHGGKEIEMPRTPELPSCRISDVEVLARHHFSSKLQRMSCVIRDIKSRRTYAVAKGSPEAIGNLLLSKPTGYDETAKILAKRGFRVIALGYKQLLQSDAIENAKDTRASCEEGVTFAGFISFTCRVRKDTKLVLKRLMEGGMSVAMVTGDALLTAAHVAKEVGICDNDNEEGDEIDPVIAMERNPELRKLLEEKAKKKTKQKVKIVRKLNEILILEQTKSGLMFWQRYNDDSRFKDFDPVEVPKLAKDYDLATTGKNLQAAFDFDEGTRKVLGHFKIFARMTPDAKETVIECLHSVGQLCMMCGDGANDVGALKQADVGVALLTGFGDVNVDKGEDTATKKDEKKSSDIPRTAIMTEEQIQAMRMVPISLIKAKIRQLGVDPNKYPGLIEKEDLITLFRIKLREKVVMDHDKKNALAKNKSNRSELMADKQAKMFERIKELEAEGVQFAQFKAMKEFWASEMAENKKKKESMTKMGGVEGQAASLTAQLEGLELEEIPMVKLGDASIAAPFTSKMPSIRSCVDIVRQGRCTLVTSMQMYQILALNCMISSYSLSVLYLDGVKYGDVQMTAMGMLMTVSFTTVSRSKPLEKLSSVQPLTSIFHPSSFISLLGQFCVHFFIMMAAVRAAKEHLPPDYEPDLDGEFHPGILNSVVFLVSNVQQVTVFVVNLQGHPFMTGLTENRPLLWSLIATFILTFMFASESVPSLNKYFQLVPFPDEIFRDYILKLLAADVLLTFATDRLMKLIFAPKILFASLKGTTFNDIFKLVKTCLIILVIMNMFLGNDEQWEEMMREEGREGELMEGSDVIANATEVILDSLQDEQISGSGIGFGEL